MKRIFVPVFVVFCAVVLMGQTKPQAKAKPAGALDKTTLTNYVRHLEAWDNTINIEVADPKPAPFAGFQEIGIHAWKEKATQDLTFYVSNDGKHILQGTLFEAADNPFKPDLEKLKTMTEHAANYGTQGAPVVIVEFSDFQCPYCKEEAKTLRTNLTGEYAKNVHLYHLDMPLDNVHPWARAAAVAGRCVYKANPKTFWDYYDWIYEHQADMTPENIKGKVLDWVKGKDSIDSLQFTRCMDSLEAEAEVTKSQEWAKSLQINQTPMFFLNGRRLAGAIDWATMKHVIDEEIEYQKTAKNAGEDCGCSMTLPTAGGQSTTNTLGGLK